MEPILEENCRKKDPLWKKWKFLLKVIAGARAELAGMSAVLAGTTAESAGTTAVLARTTAKSAGTAAVLAGMSAVPY